MKLLFVVAQLPLPATITVSGGARAQ